jgi:hypothetical protein
MTIKVKGAGRLRCVGGIAILMTVLCTFGCASIGSRTGSNNIVFKTSQTSGVPGRVLSRSDLDHVIDAKLSRQDIVSYLQTIAIEDYSIQDPNTNWSHASIGSADIKYSIYYLTYRQRYFIFLLKDVEDRLVTCLDAITAPISSSQYEIGMGPVEINHDHLDGQVVVIFNKRWKENY